MRITSKWYMVIVFMVALIMTLMAASHAVAAENGGTSIVVSPQINIKGCCSNSCNKKAKVIIKKEVVVRQVVIEKPVQKVVYVDRIIVKKQLIKKERRKNRISLLGGVGPTKLTQPTPGQVNLVTGAVGGLQYQRSITELFNIGVQVQTNKTILGNVGIDF